MCHQAKGATGTKTLNSPRSLGSLQQRLNLVLAEHGHVVQDVAPFQSSRSASLYLAKLQDGRELMVKILRSADLGSAGAPLSAEDSVQDLAKDPVRSKVLAEAAGLEALARAAQGTGLVVPNVWYRGADEGILVTDRLAAVAKQLGVHPGFEERLGAGLAALHRASSHGVEAYGFVCDTFLGDTRQPNVDVAAMPWPHFFKELRLRSVLTRIESNGSLLQSLAEQVCDAAHVSLATDEAQSCLLHGDLWSGNFFGTAAGPALFDPAAYYGHREAEFGMTSLFGGLSDRFYDAYQNVWPLELGWQKRVEIYRLYHLLNHRLLFGTGYEQQCIEAARSILDS